MISNLKTSVCVHCWKTVVRDGNYRIPGKVYQSWKKGRTNCSRTLVDAYEARTGRKVHDDDPEIPWCPYLFEHAMAAGMSDAE